MSEQWMTAEWALAQADRMEADARRMREYAAEVSNPGLLPDELPNVPGHDHPASDKCWRGCPALR